MASYDPEFPRCAVYDDLDADRERERLAFADFSTAEARAMEDHVSLREARLAREALYGEDAPHAGMRAAWDEAVLLDFVVDTAGDAVSVDEEHFGPSEEDAVSVDERLRCLAALYEERQAMYGDNYKRFGDVMHALFPNGLVLNDAHDFNRFGLFVQMVYKQTRYAAQYEDGGHPDSLDDLSVYTQMLCEIDAEGPRFDFLSL